MDFHNYLVFIVLNAILIVQVHGQLRFGRIIRDIIIDSPLEENVVQTIGEVTANVLNIMSSVPNTLSDIIGVYTIPSIENPINVADVENFVADYTLGLQNEDAHLSIEFLMYKYGFQMETHRVETDDGYILSMHRIPGNGSTIFLMHGLLGSADDFVIAGPESGLTYLLAREGYDVWMGNARGNKHSRQHKYLKSSQSAFWNFSWHEIGIYDLPAMVDYVLKVTKLETLQYIGHSQGTTSFFVMASERPEYNDKISLMVALSPVAFMSHIKSPLIRILAPGTPFIQSALSTLGIHEFLPDNILIKTLKKATCGLSTISEILCNNVIFFFTGFDVQQLNITNLPVIFGHTPSGASTKQLLHYSLGVTSGDFAYFDYGYRNEEVYGRKRPPQYQLDRIRAPVALFYSDDDWMADSVDVEKLAYQLNNVVQMYKVPYKHFNHIDFLWAKDFKNIIFNKLHDTLKSF